VRIVVPSLGACGSFLLAAITTGVITSNAYGDLSHPGRFTAELLVLIALHLLRYLRLWVSREVLLNSGFVGYALLTLAWTENDKVAFATLPAILDYILVLILFSSLIAYHNLRALLAGMVFGFAAAAAMYTLTSGFPFSYPEDFSYNTIAGMYLFGFFITAVFGSYVHMTVLPLIAGAVLLVLIAATTSIKTNLGLALGVIGAGLLYFKPTVKGIVRGVLVLAVLSAGVAYGVSSNPALTERVQNGFARVSLGLAVLANREGDSGRTGLGQRKGWEREGLKGWVATPVFGHGVEAFRADFGITSHSTPIDLLYNSGIIGFGLFYGVLGSIALRLLRARNPQRRSLRGRIAACLIAYLFISLSGLIYYDPFVAMFVAVASGLLARLEQDPQGRQAIRPAAADVGGLMPSA
jgi:O-antigen ligase